MKTLVLKTVISYRHSAASGHPETVVNYKSGSSLYRSILEACEVFKAEYGKYPNLLRLNDHTPAAHGSFVTSVIQGMLRDRGVSWEATHRVARNHLQLLFIERAALTAQGG